MTEDIDISVTLSTREASALLAAADEILTADWSEVRVFFDRDEKAAKAALRAADKIRAKIAGSSKI